MTFEWRGLRAGETDYEKVFGILYGGCLAALFVLLYQLPGGWVPPCQLSARTGIPCPTCGSYRAGEALLHGQLDVAFRFQPLGVALLLLGMAAMLYSWVVVLLRLPRLRTVGKLSRRGRIFAITLLLVMVIANWAYLLRTLGA